MSGPLTRLPDPAASTAVLIGCSDYLELPALPSVPAGLIDLRAALSHPLTGGFTPDTCHVITEPADPGRLARHLLDAARATEDTLLIYYSGHGVLDEDNNLHLALTGTSKDQALVPHTALAFHELRRMVRASPARNRLVILDCCFAGRAIHDMSSADLSTRAVITGSYVLTATDADKTARAPDGARHTAFTGALLDLLHDGIPGGPELLTLETIYPHLRHVLLRNGLPEPRRQGTDSAAGLALTRNPAPRPAPPISDPVPLSGPGKPESVVDTARTSPDVPRSTKDNDTRGFERRWLFFVAVLVAALLVLYALHDETPQLRPTEFLVGHYGEVYAVAFAPDGSTLASASWDEVKIWNPSNGDTLATLADDQHGLSAVAYAPDGKTLASIDDEVRIWDLAAFTPLSIIPTTFNEAVTAVAYAPDGKTFATAHSDVDGTVRIWDSATGKNLETLTDGKYGLTAVAYAPDGRTVATASNDGTARIWNRATGQSLRTLTGHHAAVNAVAYAPDGKTLATASSDGTVRLWNPATGQSLRTLTGHHAAVNAVAYAPDGKTLATASYDGTRIFDAATGKSLRTLIGRDEVVNAVAYAPDGKTLATAGSAVEIWHLP